MLYFWFQAVPTVPVTEKPTADAKLSKSDSSQTSHGTTAANKQVALQKKALQVSIKFIQMSCCNC